jgi:hypothetical protein
MTKHLVVYTGEKLIFRRYFVMKPSESGKKDLFGTVQGSADAALLYAKHIDRSVS